MGCVLRALCSVLFHLLFTLFYCCTDFSYDGIYKVVKYYPEKGLSGYRVWKYLLRRDDTNPAPWQVGAKEYPLVVSIETHTYPF